MKTMLITGAAGFIGNAACARFKDRYHVIGVDNMSRATSKRPEGVMFVEDDCVAALRGLRGIDVVIHLAAQVSVTNSLIDPLRDARNNVAVTLELALWAASLKPVPIFTYANTNKVFGELPGVTSPILDSQPLNPCTPYGISKATGGMYVREFLPNTGYDFRQSCIFGEAQTKHATFDQGWVGYLARQIHAEEPVVCCGDGKQVRDLLHVEDLLDVYEMAIEGDLLAGSYNIGGGPENAYSFEDVVRRLGGWIIGREPKRPRDQDYCVMASDGLRAAWWYPKISAASALAEMGIGERKETCK
jgi:CDP-paratose 2-epimerase